MINEYLIPIDKARKGGKWATIINKKAIIRYKDQKDNNK